MILLILFQILNVSTKQLGIFITIYRCNVALENVDFALKFIDNLYGFEYPVLYKTND